MRTTTADSSYEKHYLTMNEGHGFMCSFAAIAVYDILVRHRLIILERSEDFPRF